MISTRKNHHLIPHLISYEESSVIKSVLDIKEKGPWVLISDSSEELMFKVRFSSSRARASNTTSEQGLGWVWIPAGIPDVHVGQCGSSGWGGQMLGLLVPTYRRNLHVCYIYNLKSCLGAHTRDRPSWAQEEEHEV